MRHLVRLAVLVLLSATSRVGAQGPTPAPAPEQAPATPEPAPATPEVTPPPVDPRPPEQIAREAYAAGEAHYANGAYAEAEAAFIRAYQAVSNPVVLIGIAESRARLDRGVAAVEVLERYLRVRPNAADADAVRARIEALRATPGRVHVETTPAGATITIDGEVYPAVAPTEIELPAGTHVIRVALEGYEPVEGPIAVEYATRHQVHQELAVVAPEVPEEPEISDVDEDPEPERARLHPAVVTTMSVAAASLVAGTVLGFSALSRESDYNRSPRESTAEQGERLALYADLTFGVTIAATTASVVLYLVTRERPEPTEEAPLEPSEAPTVMVSPVVGRGVGGGVLTVRF